MLLVLGCCWWVVALFVGASRLIMLPPWGVLFVIFALEVFGVTTTSFVVVSVPARRPLPPRSPRNNPKPPITHPL